MAKLDLMTPEKANKILKEALYSENTPEMYLTANRTARVYMMAFKTISDTIDKDFEEVVKTGNNVLEDILNGNDADNILQGYEPNPRETYMDGIRDALYAVSFIIHGEIIMRFNELIEKEQS